MSRIKDTLTTIAGIIGGISAAVFALTTQGITVPSIVLTVAGVLGAISIGIIGFYNGKNADGSKKSN